MSDVDKMLEFARHELAAELNDMLDTICHDDLTMREYVVVVEALRPVYERALEAQRLPESPLRLVGRSKL